MPVSLLLNLYKTNYSAVVIFTVIRYLDFEGSSNSCPAAYWGVLPR